MKRINSIDVLRGMDMWFITGGDEFLCALGVWLTGSRENFLVTQMEHVDWAGLHVYDLIFPLFLFIAGLSWPFSLAGRREKGATNAAIVRHIVFRTLILVVIGLFISRIQLMDWPHFRVWSVIGRVGLAWGIAALVFTFCSIRQTAAIAATLLVGWWAACLLFVSPAAPAGAYPMASAQTFFGTWIDVNWLTTAHRFEGGFATLAMPPLVLMGMLAGTYLRWAREHVSGERLCLTLGGCGAAAIALGLLGAFCLGPLDMPIVKNCYSSTFSLVTGGIGAVLFALLYWIVDVKGCVGWSYYFRVIGANALAIYFGHYFLKFGSMSVWFLGNVPKLLSPAAGAVLIAAVGLILRFIALHFLYQRKIFIKV